nr:acid phosphatase 1-like [Ipomoea trifida]
MALTRNVVVTTFFIFLPLLSTSAAQSVFPFAAELGDLFAIDRIVRHRKIPRDDDLYCESWKFTVETNDAPSWTLVPERCKVFVQDYMTGDRFRSDSDAVANASLAFARTVSVAGDGKDAWVFDIDETLLSNVPYYEAHGFGADIFDESSFDEWVDLAEAPAISASLRLYKELREQGFTIFLLTGRSEYQRESTEKNLQYAGYSNWERLILRGPSEQGTLATLYKSQKRKELEDEGYRIHGCSGDQWSDLMGFAVAERSFKLPNPMYYIA